jgi:iron transport multicopper oxidase
MKPCRNLSLNFFPLKMQMGQSRFLTVPPLVHNLIIAALIWDMQNGTTNVKPGTTTLFHVVNIGAFGFFHFWMEEHVMTVIEVDGINVQPYKTDGISLAVGQRVSILVEMTGDPSRNYPIVGAMGTTISSQT